MLNLYPVIYQICFRIFDVFRKTVRFERIRLHKIQNKNMNRLTRLLPVYRLCSNNIKSLHPINVSARYQPRLNYSELPRVKKPGEGKGPITWKSVKIIAIGGAVLFGVLKYMESQKDAGVIQIIPHEIIFTRPSFFY